MEFIYFVNLICIFVVNILFFFLRICLNSLIDHSQFLEICATSKEVVLSCDNVFVLLRFACGFN